MRYIVGEMGSVDWFDLTLRTKHEITREDLGKCTADGSFIVFDTMNGTYYHPEKNQWVKIKEQ